MKKTKSGARGGGTKEKHRAGAKGSRGGAPKSVDDYIARVEGPARRALREMRAAIRSALPREASEVISYGIPAFQRRVVLVWYGAFADHCSLFPTAAVIEAFRIELAGYRTSKGTIHFPTGKRLPIALIKKIVKARVAAVAAENTP
jgi:uncharacterized protein YdhG (YjbR/CyaY superfamily)